MNSHRPSTWARRAMAAAILAPVLILSSALSACDSGSPEIIVVTATPTQAPVVLIVTATPGSASQAGPGEAPPAEPVTATPPLPAVTEAPMATQPPGRATANLSQLLTAQAILTRQAASPTWSPTAPVAPSETPAPPTQTPVPPTAPQPAATNTPKPAAASAVDPSWLVVYTVCKPPRSAGSYSLWQMRGDGSRPEQIRDLASEPSFSADGNLMVYYRWIEGLRVVYLNRNPQQEIVSRGDGNASFPSLSPDGKQIVYHQIPSNWQGQFNLRICNVDGSNDHHLTPGSRPHWSPKGDMIAYDSCNQSNQCGIFVVRPNGQGVRQLTTDVGGGPAWSPDGRRIAYASATDGDFEIYVMNADGSGRKQLTHNKGNDALPAWSPDGNFIYYRSDANGTVWSIWVVGADGSNARKLVNAPACDLWNFEKLTVTK